MKTTTILLLAITITLTTLLAGETTAGPRGGRLLALEGQKAEFFVEPDRTVSIVFYDDAMKKIAPGTQAVTATAEATGEKTKLEFKVKDGVLVSTAPLPKGEGYLVVVQVRQTPESKPKNFRITFDTHLCDSCKLSEYACICNH